ncbi:MAG: SGNH/GDSL hydrolase family protein [Micromonosporaceae bacterium]
MSSPRRRQLLLSLITIVAMVSTLLVAAAKSRVDNRPAEAWVGSWATAPQPAPVRATFDPLALSGFKDQTIRMVVRTSVGGSKGRIRVSNRFGAKPLTVGHTTMALPLPDAGPGDLHPTSVHEVTFGGQASVIVPPGGTVFSDATDMAIPWTGDVAISIYLPTETGPPTLHNLSRTTVFIGSGDHASAASGAELPKTMRTWFFVTGLDVLNRTGAGSIAVLGDSITDGNGSTNNTHHRWTNFLASRLVKEAPDGRAPGVLNLGIAGNRLGHEGIEFGSPEFGPTASGRFAQDVLAQTGVRAVVVELGINDVWINHDDPNLIIAELRQLATLAHQAGLRIYVCTLMPWGGFAFPAGVVQYTPTTDSIRLMVNSYLRTTADFDGLLDFDKVLRDPGDPTKLRTDYDVSDHIHPNDAGLEAMAKSIPLEMLLRR